METTSFTVSGTADLSAAIPVLGGLDGVVGALPLPWLRICRLGADDKAALTRHLLDLPEADRCTRFGGQSSDAAICRHCETLDLADTICWAALDGDGDVVGAALGFACGAMPGGAGALVEVAVSVEVAHRRRGLGAHLAAQVCTAAEQRGASGAAFEFHPRNTAIRGLIRRLGGQLAPLAEDCVVPLPVPSGPAAPDAALVH